jgi:hypothetical protein
VTFLIQSLAVLLIFSSAGFVFYQNTVHLLAIILSEIFHYIAAYCRRPEHIFTRIVSYIFSLNLMNVISVYVLHPHNGEASVRTWTKYQSLAWTGIILQIAIESVNVLLKHSETGSRNRQHRLILASMSILITLLHLFNSFQMDDSLEFVLLMKCSIDAVFHGLKAVQSFLAFDEMVPSCIITTTPLLLDLLRQILWLTISTTIYLSNKRIRAESMVLAFCWIIITSQYLFGSIRLCYSLFVQFILAYKFASVFKKLHPNELAELDSEDNCPICLSEHSITTRRLPCGHLLHMPCATRMMQQNRNAGQNNPHRCPVCRRDLFDSSTSILSAAAATSTSAPTGAAGGAGDAAATRATRGLNVFDIVSELRSRRPSLFDRGSDRNSNSNATIRLEIQTFSSSGPHPASSSGPVVMEARIRPAAAAAGGGTSGPRVILLQASRNNSGGMTASELRLGPNSIASVSTTNATSTRASPAATVPQPSTTSSSAAAPAVAAIQPQTSSLSAIAVSAAAGIHQPHHQQPQPSASSSNSVSRLSRVKRRRESAAYIYEGSVAAAAETPSATASTPRRRVRRRTR